MPSCACEFPGTCAAGVSSLLPVAESDLAFLLRCAASVVWVQSFSARFAAEGTSCCARSLISLTTCARVSPSRRFADNICVTCSPSCRSPCSAFSMSCRIAAVMRPLSAAPSALPAAGNACSSVRSIALPTLRSKSSLAAFSNAAYAASCACCVESCCCEAAACSCVVGAGLAPPGCAALF